MEDFFSSEMETSRLAVIVAKKKKQEASSCGCSCCQLAHEMKESTLLNERLATAQHRLGVLREFRIMKDEELLHRTSSGFTKGKKYFTPVGGSKAKGVTALRPTVQLQNSYDVTALTTNSMSARPLKIAWKDKPKPLRIVQVSKEVNL